MEENLQNCSYWELETSRQGFFGNKSVFLNEYLTNSTFLGRASVFQEKVFRIGKDRGGKTSHDSNFPTETPKSKQLSSFIHMFIHSHSINNHSSAQLFTEHLLCSK